MHFLDWKSWHFDLNVIEISSWGPILNETLLVWVAVWRRAGDRPLPEPMLIPFTNAYRHQCVYYLGPWMVAMKSIEFCTNIGNKSQNLL